jgi:glycosyltransferase involved in cell wall biosynthesis
MNQIKDFARDNNLSNNMIIISNVYDDLILSFFYSVCDIFALNSNNDSGHFEGFGLVLLEAAQFGKPVVGSKDCGIESAIWNCYNGFLTEQGNHIDISNKIGDILDGKQSFFSQNSLEFYKRFSWNKTVKEYYKNYIL